MKRLLGDCGEFGREFVGFCYGNIRLQFIRFEFAKKIFVTRLYKQRGKQAKRFIHSGMAGITALGVMITPIVAQEFPGSQVNPWESQAPPAVLSLSSTDTTETIVGSKQARGETEEYTVQEGDTLSVIAQKFGVSVDTIKWANDIESEKSIKAGQKIRILPLDGVSHKVKKGDTVFSIAKKYDVDPQAVVDYPFNAFRDDETFELAIGQELLVPGGILPAQRASAPRVRQITPDAGTVVASGSFVWPVQGRITQNWIWYHPGIDIANKSLPPVLAADAGTVTVAGWPDNYGYGNRIVIDHGNGTKTLYAHLSGINVIPGQTVRRGDVIGRMGSTGRSTGPHLHFEIIRGGVKINPLSVLR